MQGLIDKWFSKVEPYLFNYKDGFYVLPMVSNTPQTMMASIHKMPFVKRNKELQRTESHSPFVDAYVYDCEVNHQLFGMYSELHYKKNVTFKYLMNGQMESTYYCLSRFVHMGEEGSKRTNINGNKFNTECWLFLKPNAFVNDFHLEDTYANSLTIYFSEEWLRAHLNKQAERYEVIHKFLVSTENVLLYSPQDSTINAPSTVALVDAMKRHDPDIRKNTLEAEASNFLALFIDKCIIQMSNPNYYWLNFSDRAKLEEAEILLNSLIYKKFPGIKDIAFQVGLSETRLKNLFKITNNCTLLDYYNLKKMNKAAETLKSENISIADLALRFGYENPSKFAVAFKKINGYLPSVYQRMS